jgi:glycosyltransferase involved in cell wall biosynthesis
MNNPKIIFILSNIYEIANGVSTKYITFIEYLLKNNNNIVLFTTFKNIENYQNCQKDKNLQIIKTKGLIIPFYNTIKIPLLKDSKLKEHITDGNEIIIFNGEFIWLYEMLYKIKKKHPNIKIYPNMHTDYIYYGNEVYSKFKFYNFKFDYTSLLSYLDNYLEKKIFNGIIVTGEKLKTKYCNVTNSIFNANEINIDTFNNIKKDDYDNNFYNIIYCGRISKEKNIEEIIDCCQMLNDKYNYYLNIIGDGPYIDTLKTIIDLQYSKIKSKIIFHGNKDQKSINSLYQSMNNRIFLFTSISETFGKTPMEAGATGIPIFIKKCDISDMLYINKRNAMIFDNKNDFFELFVYFIEMDKFEKELFISNSINNIKKYDQNIIFKDWSEFLIKGKVLKKNDVLNFYDMLTFHGLIKLINCSGSIIAD